MKQTFKPGDRVRYYNQSKASNAQKIKCGTFMREITRRSRWQRFTGQTYCVVRFDGNMVNSKVLMRALEPIT